MSLYLSSLGVGSGEIGKILYYCEWSCYHQGWIQIEMKGLNLLKPVAIFKKSKKKK